MHLTVEIVLEIHSQALKNFGGSPGIRDEGLLASAVFAPQSTFGGKSPFADIIEVAAAYLFYLCGNHPFVDGNKRVAFAVVDVFLRINGYSITADSKAIYDHMIKLVEARAFDLEHLVPWLQEIVRPRA